MASAIVAIEKDINKVNALKNLSLKENVSFVINKVINLQSSELRSGILLNNYVRKLLVWITTHGTYEIYVVSMDTLMKIV